MHHPARGSAPERRWPMATAVLVAIVLQVITPHTGRLVFWWVFPVLEVAALVAVIVRDPGRIDRRTRAARRTTLVLIALLTVGTLGGLVVLALDIIDKSYAHVGATALLGRGAALWVTNVVVFSLWFWEVDRGGAAERAAGSKIPPSFGFPEEAMPELVPDGWMPRYPDYLFLSFTNATAFSPTDTLARADLGEDDDDGRIGDLVDHRHPRHRAGDQRAPGVRRERATPATGLGEGRRDPRGRGARHRRDGHRLQWLSRDAVGRRAGAPVRAGIVDAVRSGGRVDARRPGARRGLGVPHGVAPGASSRRPAAGGDVGAPVHPRLRGGVPGLAGDRPVHGSGCAAGPRGHARVLEPLR